MTAEGDLASVRSSLLMIVQTGDADLSGSRRTLSRLRTEAEANSITTIADLCIDCEASLDQISTKTDPSPAEVNVPLDIVARIEAAVWALSMRSDLTDFDGFIDASFDGLIQDATEPAPVLFAERFDVDEETLEVFRCEAEELLASTINSLQTLSKEPSDQNAIWDIRRNAHTFKGAAGIVGLTEASDIAHRMEDLLDKMVEMRCDAAPKIVDFLEASACQLKAIITAKVPDDQAGDLSERFADAMSSLTSPVDPAGNGQTPFSDAQHSSALSRPDSFRTTTKPIVRVSLERLDELIKVSRSLVSNRAALTERLSEYHAETDVDADWFSKISTLLDAQRILTDDIQAKLLQVRMVKFGTLETRLSRAVNVTCHDEGKKAVVEIENGDVEIDTQVIDALIEPLLHLLKNAVVHGIEPPDTRRLIGKPERGTVRIDLDADDEALVLSISDDGGGLCLPKLKERAIANGILNADQAATMNDRDAMDLVFDRGLTTADTINLNAGRGVGMSIVKESIESRGGKVVIASEPQRGTTFTILMPLLIGRPAPVSAEPIELSEEPADPAPPLILVIDDSTSVRHRTSKLIEAEGFRVITATNGAEALELLLSNDWEPDLILSDIEMPQIDGWNFLEYMKTDDNFGHIPVVMVTSLDTDEHRKRAFELGASDYFIKPLNKKDLAEVLESLRKPLPA